MSQTNKPVLLILDLHHNLAERPYDPLALSQRLLELGFEVSIFDEFFSFLEVLQKFQTPSDPRDCQTHQKSIAVVWLENTEQLYQDIDLQQQMQALNVGQNQPTPWVVLSDQADMAKQIAAFQAGVSHYWVQPKDTHELVQRLNQLLGQKHQPYRVVMVDDSKVVLSIQTQLLKRGGFEVWASENPMDLPELLHTAKPDVLVLDLHMPQACGAQVAWAVRQAQSEAELPIIFVSGEDELNLQMLALKQGGDDFLVKPVNPQQFIETVKMRAERARQHNRVQSLLKQKLYEQSREHQALNQHAIVSVADRAGNIVDVNQKFCEISGFKREELIGKNHRMIKSSHHPRCFYEDLWQTISSGDVWQGDICNLSKQGTEYWVRSTITPFLDEQGQIYQYVSIRTDITQLKILEMAQEKRLFEQGERVKEWRCLNKVMTLLAEDEHSDSELLYKVVNAIPAGWRHPYDTCALIELNGESYATEGFVETRWCQSSLIELEHLTGRVMVCRLDPDPQEMADDYGVLLVEEQRLLDNIGLQIGQAFKRREAKRNMEMAREEAERANRAKSDFLSAMSHELRTPLNSIIGFSQLLELSVESDKQKQQLHTIASSGKHLLSLINDVLEFAKLETGKLSLNIESTDPLPIIEQVVALSESYAYAKNIEVIQNPWQKTVHLSVDPVRFKQVMLNLMTNAIKYNRSNGKVILHGEFEKDSEGHYFRLDVQDTGVGIASEYLPRVFEPFDRLGHEGSCIEGTGIGLSITKDLVEQMGGRIDVHSELDVGTTFQIWLPVDETVDETIEPSPPKSDISDYNEPHQSWSKQANEQSLLKILYVEDNPSNMILMSQLAQLVEGVELRISPSAENGLQQAQAWLPQLILLDINLPAMNGDKALAKFKSIENYEQPPVVYAITANVLEEQLAHYQQIGFDKVIAKPFDLSEMIEPIEALKRQITSSS